MWTETFGNTLCVLSLHLGIPPEEVALIVAGIMGNLSGPAAGVVGASSRRVPPGFSLLSVGEPDFRSARLLDYLLAPALGIQDVLRNNALRAHRPSVDLHCFGPGDVTEIESLRRTLGGIRDRCLTMLAAAEADVQRSDQISPGWDTPLDPAGPCLWGEGEDRLLNERLPGPKHRPSFIFTTSDVSRIDELLAETMDQHVFLVDSSGGFFRGTFHQSCKHGNEALARFARILSGADVSVPPLHPLQGYGRYQRAGIRFLASVSGEALAEMAGSREAAPQQVLSNAILWRPTWRSIREVGPDHGLSAWAALKHAMLNVVNYRISRSGPSFRATKEEASALERIETRLYAEMDRQPEAFRPALRCFSSIVPALFWAFSLLQREKDDWAMRATEATAFHALRKHTELLVSAINQAKQERLTRTAERIIAVLLEKGDCGTRELQRSIFRCKRDELAPALELLVRTARIGIDQGTRRYRITGGTTSAVTNELSTPSPSLS
jgi:hypothetical protein